MAQVEIHRDSESIGPKDLGLRTLKASSLRFQVVAPGDLISFSLSDFAL